MLDGEIQGETAGLTRLGRWLQAQGYRFVTPTPATHARVLARPGRERAHDLEGVFGWSLPFDPAQLPDGLVPAMQEAGVLLAEGGRCRSAVRFSSLDGELFVHSAYPTAAADSVFFGPDTYRFAQAIEAELARRAAAGRGVRRAVDLGCGAGPGAVLMARAQAGADVTGVDINEAALRLTRVNAALAGVAVRPVRSDLLQDVDGTFDLIVSNPPYLVDPGERAYRHGGGPLGAGLSLRILDAAIERLAPGGTLVLYTGVAMPGGAAPFRAAAAARLEGTGLSWTYREMDPDVFGEELETATYAACDRIAAVVLTATKNE